jgi:hypothetical protein
MKRTRKILLWVLGVSVVLVGGAWLGVTSYVNSSYGRQAAGEQLTALVGLPVQVQSLSVGAATTSVAFSVADGDSKSPAAESPPLLKVGTLETDVSLMDLIAGRVSPTTVTAKDVDVLLRLDAENRLLSTVPKASDAGGGTAAVPVIHLTNLRVRIQQPGHPDFDLPNISGDIRPDGDGYAVTGQTDGSPWGKWAITGRLAPKTGQATITLTADDAPLNADLLRSIPAVPPDTWDHLDPSGRTAATVTLTRRPGVGVDYNVELRPAGGATLRFPDADATVTNVAGRVGVAAGKVKIDDGRVTLADGTVTVNGVYDFEKPDRVFATKLGAKGVDVRKLPPSWGLPDKIEGKLRGTADLQLHVTPDGKLDPRGSGTGEIVGAKFAGLDAEIQLKLNAREGRYRFETAK